VRQLRPKTWPHLFINTAASGTGSGFGDGVIANCSRQIIQIEGYSSKTVAGRIASSSVERAISVGDIEGGMMTDIE
jgi:hypothetical protein